MSKLQDLEDENARINLSIEDLKDNTPLMQKQAVVESILFRQNLLIENLIKILIDKLD